MNVSDQATQTAHVTRFKADLAASAWVACDTSSDWSTCEALTDRDAARQRARKAVHGVAINWRDGKPALASHGALRASMGA